jgi:V8-like Glu-specific endopeptidase
MFAGMIRVYHVPETQPGGGHQTCCAYLQGSRTVLTASMCVRTMPHQQNLER